GAVAMLVLEERPRQQRAQVEVAATVLHQQQQAVRAVALAVVRHPHIAAQNRLDPAFACGLVEADRAEEIRTVGEGERALSVHRGLRYRIVDAHDAVDDGKLRMQAKMDELLTT